MKTLNVADLIAAKNTKGEAEGPERAEFLADTLHCVITTPSGKVVLETNLAPRGFRAKTDSRKNGGKPEGGVGWYADVRGDQAGAYGPFAVTAGLRLSLDKVKVEPGTTVDLRGAAEIDTSEE